MKLSWFAQAEKETKAEDWFDPGKEGKQSAGNRMVSRLLDLIARTYHVKRPAFKELARYLIIFFSKADNLAIPPLTAEERLDLQKKYMRGEQTVPSELQEELTPEE